MKHTRILLGFLLAIALAGCAPSQAQSVDATPAFTPTSLPPVAPATAAPATAAPATGAPEVGVPTTATPEAAAPEAAAPEAVAPVKETTAAPTAVPDRAEAASGQSTSYDPPPERLVYASDDYGFAFSYPPHWTLTESPAERGTRAPHTIALTWNTLRLLVQVKQSAEQTMVGPGGHGAGDIVDRGTVLFFGQERVKKALVYEGRVKSVFLGQPVEDLLFWVQLDCAAPGVAYGSIDLGEVVQAEFDRVLASFQRTLATSSWEATGWPGYVVGNPPGAQFDDALVLLPEGAGRVGVAGSTPELEAEIVALRDKPEPGKQAHFWGTLTCDVPDVGGCQLVVTRLRYGASATGPQPVEGWEGTLVRLEGAGGSPPRTQFDDAFVLSGRFGVAYGMHSLDAGLQAQLEALRETGTPFRAWGVLRCGVPDAYGSQIEVSRIEVL